MSAPQTNIDTQKRRHKGPLIGMALAVVFGVGLILYWMLDEAAEGQSPLDAEPAAETGTAPQPATPPAGSAP